MLVAVGVRRGRAASRPPSSEVRKRLFSVGINVREYCSQFLEGFLIRYRYMLLVGWGVLWQWSNNNESSLWSQKLVDPFQECRLILDERVDELARNEAVRGVG